jgi:hypothetical protein
MAAKEFADVHAPLPSEMHGPIRKHLAALVAEKIHMLGAENRV